MKELIEKLEALDINEAQIDKFEKALDKLILDNKKAMRFTPDIDAKVYKISLDNIYRSLNAVSSLLDLTDESAKSLNKVLDKLRKI